MDLDENMLKELHDGCRARGCDLYSYLKERFPASDTQQRLKYLAAVLNEFLEDYEYDKEDRIKEDGYLIVRFFPKDS